MFVRSKEVKGHTYYQAVQGYRDDSGKVRHRTIVSLGRNPTIRDALDSAERELSFARELRTIWDGWAEEHPDDESVREADRGVAAAEARVELLRSIVDTEYVRPAAKVAVPLDRIAIDAAIDAAFAGACAALADAAPPPRGPTPARRGAVAAVVKMLASKGERIDVASILGTLSGVPGFNEGSVAEILDTLKASGDYDRLVS